jgi:hypothetical protein
MVPDGDGGGALPSTLGELTTTSKLPFEPLPSLCSMSGRRGVASLSGSAEPSNSKRWRSMIAA